LGTAPEGKEHLTSRYAEILDQQKKRYTEFVECPSRFEPEPVEPLCMSRVTRKFNAGGKSSGIFADGTHTAWEEF